MNQHADSFMKFTDTAVTSYHSILHAKEMLTTNGFHELSLNQRWQLVPGKSYYVNIYDTSLVAFRISDHPNGRLHIAAAHTDYPCLKIKPSCEINANGYAKVNVIVYGGAIYNTWFDRPLSLAGKVVTKSDSVFEPNEHLINIEKPILVLPNLAIHMNREVNKGVSLNPQSDMLPIAGMIGEQLSGDDFLLKFLASQLGTTPDEILDYDLTIYASDPSCYVGINDDFISGSRIDNQTSVVSALDGICHGTPSGGINMIVLFDNEEIGSKTKQGADSAILTLILEKMYDSVGIAHMDARDLILSGFFLSMDVAHALHPNHPEKCDPTNQPLLGKGIVIKQDLNQKYATDVKNTAVLRQLCEKENIPYQVFVNRNDVPGGSTLGTIISSHLPMRTVDIGIPLLAMHSARELMGSADQQSMDLLIRAFFSI